MDRKIRVEKLESRLKVQEPVEVYITVIAPRRNSIHYDPTFPYGKCLSLKELNEFTDRDRVEQ